MANIINFRTALLVKEFYYKGMFTLMFRCSIYAKNLENFLFQENPKILVYSSPIIQNIVNCKISYTGTDAEVDMQKSITEEPTDEPQASTSSNHPYEMFIENDSDDESSGKQPSGPTPTEQGNQY